MKNVFMEEIACTYNKPKNFAPAENNLCDRKYNFETCAKLSNIDVETYKKIIDELNKKNIECLKISPK